MIEDPELRRLFEAESAEHLARLDDGLLGLEKRPADFALLEEAFRESHSLKGAARMLGLARIETTAHGLETILNAARKDEAPLTPELIERMNAALVTLRRHVQEALAGEPAVPPPAHKVSSQGTPDACPSSTAEDEPRRDALPGEAVGIPSRANGGELDRGPLSPEGDATQRAQTHRSGKPAPAPEPFRIETVRVETRKLDELLTQVGELSVIQGRAQHRLAVMDELLERWQALERGRRRAGPVVRQGVEVEAPLRFAGLLKETRDALFDVSARLESTVKLLEDQVRGIRLMPLSTVLALFPRMLRDLARDQGKEVELVIEGGEITVDKRILEEMKDPLMHLIRNAVDHGIEPPAERERLGKPRGGTVRLRVVREDANVMLEVQDDGRGLDLTAIRQQARQRGLHDDATLSAIAPAQLQQLIFMPGFSTSTYVTELSGRGVGLDVVRVNVERMKGGIRLESAAGQGLKVQLRLPLSLATTRLLLASVRGRLYGLPVEFVHTSLRVRPEDIFTIEGGPAVLLDGQTVVAARLTDLLELPAGVRGAVAPDTLVCIVMQVGDERLGLLADDLLTEEEVVPKPLGAPLLRVRNVSALAMLGSGEICAVLGPGDLLRSARKKGVTLRGEEPRLRSKAHKPAVLLAEDSALIRAMEKRILEDGGYEVVTAVDGVDALNALGSRPFAAVVSDIMMPNMDGLALTARIRAEPRYKELPVILVTTLASDQDKRSGLDAGASAYLPKPSFDQRLLLDTLKRLVVT